MFRVTFFGTGNALGYVNRDHTSILIQHRPAGTAYLVDCCSAPWAKLQKAGVRADELAGIILTHAHVDHIYGLPILIQSLWLAGREKPMTVYCPEGAGRTVRGLVDLFDLTRKHNIFAIEVVEQSLDGESPLFSSGGLSVYTFPALHGVPTMGVRFQEQGDTRLINLVYSADTVYNPLLETVAKEATCLIHECTGASTTSGQHSTVHDVYKLIEKTNPRQVVLVHLTEGENYEGLLEQYGLTQPRVMIAEDGMSLHITR